MKKTFLLICSCVFYFALVHATSNSSLYYYSLGKRCELSRKESKLAVLKDCNIDRESFLQTLSFHSQNHNIEWRGNDICIIEFTDTLEINRFKRLDDFIIWPVYTINHHTEAVLFSEKKRKADIL